MAGDVAMNDGLIGNEERTNAEGDRFGERLSDGPMMRRRREVCHNEGLFTENMQQEGGGTGTDGGRHMHEGGDVGKRGGGDVRDLVGRRGGGDVGSLVGRRGGGDVGSLVGRRGGGIVGNLDGRRGGNNLGNMDGGWEGGDEGSMDGRLEGEGVGGLNGTGVSISLVTGAWGTGNGDPKGFVLVCFFPQN
ncbi:PREDICTED: rRNA 2'-O-methyltransferase fibrillarin-like [Ipomoea nil]|uniref:rRNA 2'-O-methyltransferase fibrillarin-like n=1 Tax=Ipomoea nil TaxID=35883 RepID=UPI0009019027|nr:PREDICTED: rRNA 2'-O-methyltransferase fibrillarin-like [Ipomoea nil]